MSVVEERYSSDRVPRISLIDLINPADWYGKSPPARQWLIDGVAIQGGITLLNGEGGVGKSLLCMQMQTAAALSMPWLGIRTPAGGIRSLGVYCEDEPDELHRRQVDICRYYSCDVRDLDGRVTMMSRAGADSNTLMLFNKRDHGGQITPLFRQIEQIIVSHGIQLVIVDTVADTFGGKEIERDQVRTFVQRLRSWAMLNRGAVIITQHPSITGIASGSGSSGSTGWHNSVRNRLYLTAPKRLDDDGDDVPHNERTLKVMKSNYGPRAGKIRLVWRDGVLITVGEAGPASLYDALTLQEKLLDFAVWCVGQGIETTPDPQSRSGLVPRARSRENMAQVPTSYLLKAQEDLTQAGKLSVVNIRKSNRMVGTVIRPSWLKFATEQGAGNP